jgi:hypothetical protein
MLIDAQQEQIDIELEFQDVMRSGMIYGHRVQQGVLAARVRDRRRVKRRMFKPGAYVVGEASRNSSSTTRTSRTSTSSTAMWDPYADGIRVRLVRASHVARARACLDRIESGKWNTETAKAADRGRAAVDGPAARSTTRSGRSGWRRRGFGSFGVNTRGEQIHEVLEWHDGDQV